MVQGEETMMNWKRVLLLDGIHEVLPYKLRWIECTGMSFVFGAFVRCKFIHGEVV